MNKNGEILAESHYSNTGFARYFDAELERLYCGFEKLQINKKDLNHAISKTFDMVYRFTPSIKNEILTTFKKSGNVTRIVRKVVRHLLEGEQIKEKSREALVVKDLFDSNDLKIQNIRDEMEKFIHLSGERRNLGELYDVLINPPYGLTRQIVSLLLLDVLLAQGDRVSLFEKRMFQLEINPLLFDRLMVNPANFEVQKNVFSDDKGLYLENFAKMLKQDTTNLLDLTKAVFYKVRDIDKYTKHTDSLSKNTLKLRNTILNAKEPYKLVFNDIPVALGFRGYEQCNNEFFNLLTKSITELDNNYAMLLAEMETFLFESFGLETGAKGRELLVKRIETVEEFIAESEVKTVVNSIKINNLPHNRWLERVATVINKKNVPKNWTDNDLADYKQKILGLAGEIKRLEVISSQGVSKMPEITIDDELRSVMDTINSFSTLQKLFLMSVLKKDIA